MPIPPFAGCPAPVPGGGEPLQFLGVDVNGDPAWMTAPYANYLFNSSGSQQGNRFNDWSDLMDALALVEGPKTVTFEQDDSIPAGAYDLDNVTFRGNFLPLGGGGFFITLEDGVTITSLDNFVLDGGIGLVNDSSSPAITVPNGDFVILQVLGNSGISSTNAPMVDIEPGGNFVVALRDGATVADLGFPVINVQVGAGLAAAALGGVASAVQDNTISGDGAFIRLIQSIAVDIDSGLVQPSFAGIIVDQLFTDARLLGYNPATSGGVLSSTNVQAAIDELAGLV